MHLKRCMHAVVGTHHVCIIIATHLDFVARVTNNEITLLQSTSSQWKQWKQWEQYRL